MNNVKFFFKNYAFMLKKCNACTIILLVVALIISISGFFYGFDANQVISDAKLIDVNAGVFLPMLAVVFSFFIGLNFFMFAKNYNLSVRYQNLASISVVLTFCTLMAIVFGISVYFTHVIAYASNSQVVPIVYNKSFVEVLTGMFAVFLYSLLASSIGYFLAKLVSISGYFSVLLIGYVCLIFYAFQYGGYNNANFVLVVINFILNENNIGLLVAKVIPFAILFFGLDHLICEKRGVR